MLMQGFPPAKDGQVTLANWQDPPYNRWSFSHLRELVPTQRIGGGTGTVMSLASDPQPVGELPVPRVAGGTTDLDRVLDDTYTDAVVVVHDGRIVWERYFGETRPDTAHLLMSISKSVVGCVVASLVDRGQMHPAQLVTDHVPELAHSGYRGARVRHLLDMRSGIKFSEQYTDLDAEVRVIEQAMGWRPASHYDVPRSMYGYLTTLTQAREHGGVFEYRSCETDVLGWVCERAAGTRMADLIADRVWVPIGAERDAEITCDGVGTAVHDGGMCATARDLARFGMMLLADGEVAGRTVVPAEWLRASWTVDTDVREAFARSASGPYLPGGWYRNQFWFLPREHGPVLLCLGIYGQMLYVNPATATVAAKLSSWPDAQAPALLHDTINAFDAVGAVLAGHPANAARLHGLPGLAAGLSRRGGSGDTGQRSDHRLRLATRPAERQEDKMLEPPSPVPTSTAGRRLNGISEIRGYFRTNTEPVYFFGPTAFNLLGIDRWVRNFFYVAYYDSWDGAHPRVFSPRSKPYVEFTSSEDINNYLLRDPEVQAFIVARGGRPRVAMVFFDEETERLCEELGYDLILPSDALRRHLDSKIVTTRLGNEAGAPSVPNVLVEVDSWGTLVRVATDAGLGTDLVVQTPYGDSGKTTFFLHSERDWSRYGVDIAGQHVKVMKRINNKAAAVEGVLTRHGTVVGPFMTDLTGYPELTPYKGGWCGNDLFPEALSEAHRARAIELVRRLGDRLGAEGYRGFFEVDVLVDLDADEVYLGELNPRISGASSITNVTAGAYADIPLFLFHLLEYCDVDYRVDVDEINERWRQLAAVDVWAQLIMKEPHDAVERIVEAPRTGTYHLNEDGSVNFVHISYDWHEVTHEDEAFFLRVYAPGDYRFRGADLGILVTKGRMQTAEGLTDRARRWIDGIRQMYVSEPLNTAPPVAPVPVVK